MFRTFGFGGIVALLLTAPASAQTVGTTTVTALQSLCDPYLAGTPFAEAALDAGFWHDTEYDEYYFGPEEEVTTLEPAVAGECEILVLYTDAEGPELLASITAFVEGRGGRKVLDRYHDSDDEMQAWLTEWQLPGQSVSLMEMAKPDGSHFVDGFHLLSLMLSPQ
jgi:hypothetical protein